MTYGRGVEFALRGWMDDVSRERSRKMNRRVRDLASELARTGPISLSGLRAHVESGDAEVRGAVKSWSDAKLTLVLSRGGQLRKCKMDGAREGEFVWVRNGEALPKGCRFAPICAVVMIGLNERINGREGLTAARRAMSKMITLGQRRHSVDRASKG
jgi:hypothetical protein